MKLAYKYLNLKSWDLKPLQKQINLLSHIVCQYTPQYSLISKCIDFPLLLHSLNSLISTITITPAVL